MHIGYFYDDGRESAQRRLAVFRDISFEEGGYSASFGSGDFNVGQKRSRFPLKVNRNFEILTQESGNILNIFFL